MEQRERKDKVKQVTSFIDTDGTRVELALSDDGERTVFAWRSDEGIVLTSSYGRKNGESVQPLRASHSLIKNQVVLLPRGAKEFSSLGALKTDIASYIERYVTLSEDFLVAAIHYVLLSWRYDEFNEIPYLRFKGDFGSGKTRALLVIGSICYLPIFASGASTVSPIFHTLDLFRGTLIFDEADFRFSDEKSDIIKIFNNGTMKGFPVLRASVGEGKDFEPRAFAVFGPKLIGMRENFDDMALESRFLTEEMTMAPKAHVPVSLPDAQRAEADELRSQLLSFRLSGTAHGHQGADVADARTASRTEQMLAPLLAMTTDAASAVQIRGLAERQSAALTVERSTHMEALILSVLLAMIKAAPEQRHIPLADIKDAVLRRHGDDFDRPLSSRRLGHILRHKLGLQSFKSGVYMVPVPPPAERERLVAKYGLASGGT